jgi:Pup amidohydrolase
MAIPKICGIETEYGIAVRDAVEFNPILTSSVLINSYALPAFRRVKWDYEEESPLRDARGFDRSPAEGPVEDETGLVNIILPNGSRFYVDHAHPEYSSPECTDARAAVVWDKAGERILERSMQAARDVITEGRGVSVYKNNSDGKGNSYGCHENYLVDRATPFPALVKHLIPFFVSRQVFTGAGKVGAENSSEEVDYQISQRADFFEVEVGLETTLKRPLMNTRDEPHADPERYRRLHVINGDANLCEVATFLKVGTMLLVLDLIEDEELPDPPEIVDPVAAFHAVSHDLTQAQALRLADGRRATPLEIQWHYLEAAKRYVKDRDREVEPVTAEVLARWESVLTTAEEDPRRLAGQVDWATKLELLEAYRARDGLAWEHDRLKAIDLQYHDVRRDKGLYQRLAARGRVERMVAESEIQAAMTAPPEDTRAWFRGECLRRFRTQVVAAGWDSLIFDVGKDALQRLPMMEPGRGTRAHVGDLLDEVADAGELLERLTASPQD